jgi:hypothetical protein
MKNVFWLFVTKIVLLTSTGCVSINSFQDGRTLSKEKIDLGISANYGDLTNYSNQDSFQFPHLEIFSQIGITNRFDVGIKLNSSSMIGSVLKFQILGNKESKLAMSIGNQSGIGPLRLLLGGINYYTSFSIYNSIHINEKIAIILTPTYIISSDRLFDWPGKGINDPIEIDNNEAVGVSYGLIIGKKNRIGIEISHLGKNIYCPTQIGVNYTIRLDRKEK